MTDQIPPNDVTLEHAICAERNQSVGDDLAGRASNLDARLLLSCKTPDDRFQDRRRRGDSGAGD